MKKENFDKQVDGKQVSIYEIGNKNGYKLALTNFGGRMQSLFVKDKEGQLVDILCGFDTIEEYLEDDTNQGASIGRVGNRIAFGKFELEGKTYDLTKNIANTHHLHGGIKGFSYVVWEVVEHTDNSITYTYTSPDGDQGYPGELTAKITLEWTDTNVLKTTLRATAKETTIVNLTLHPYFNLKGEGTKDIAGQRIMIAASNILEFGPGAVATGKILPIEGTPFDFRTQKEVDFEAVMKTQWGQEGEGVDHFYVLDKYDGKMNKVAAAECDNGISMEIWSDQPGVQCYTSNFLDKPGKGGKYYYKHSAFCLETQVHPNAINIPEFPCIILKKGEEYEQFTEYRF